MKICYKCRCRFIQQYKSQMLCTICMNKNNMPIKPYTITKYVKTKVGFNNGLLDKSVEFFS